MPSSRRTKKNRETIKAAFLDGALLKEAADKCGSTAVWLCQWQADDQDFDREIQSCKLIGSENLSDELYAELVRLTLQENFDRNDGHRCKAIGLALEHLERRMARAEARIAALPSCIQQNPLALPLGTPVEGPLEREDNQEKE